MEPRTFGVSINVWISIKILLAGGRLNLLGNSCIPINYGKVKNDHGEILNPMLCISSCTSWSSYPDFPVKVSDYLLWLNQLFSKNLMLYYIYILYKFLKKIVKHIFVYQITSDILHPTITIKVQVQIIQNAAHRSSTWASFTTGSGTTMQENQPASQIATRHNIFPSQMGLYILCIF